MNKFTFLLLLLVAIGLFGGVVFLFKSIDNNNHILVVDSNNNVLYHGSYDYYWYGDLYVRIDYKDIIYNFTCNDYVIYKNSNCILCGDVDE